jgi:hypothetical protein
LRNLSIPAEAFTSVSWAEAMSHLGLFCVDEKFKKKNSVTVNAQAKLGRHHTHLYTVHGVILGSAQRRSHSHAPSPRPTQVESTLFGVFAAELTPTYLETTWESAPPWHPPSGPCSHHREQTMQTYGWDR